MSNNKKNQGKNWAKMMKTKIGKKIKKDTLNIFTMTWLKIKFRTLGIQFIIAWVF